MVGTNKDLIVPNKDSKNLPQPEEGVNYRAIEQWANALKEGGFYASLTGAGETSTPGDLTQLGGFTVNDEPGGGITLETTGFMSLYSDVEILIDSQGPLVLIGHGTTVSAPSYNLELTGGTISFFDPSPAANQQTVTGSIGGSVALTNLLAALAAYGLIINDTTP